MTITNIANALANATPLQDGAFVLDEVLGEGGFGITYRAHEVCLNRLVAIKEFFPTGCARTENLVQFPGDMSEREQHEARHNFLNEARILARLRHPHIVGVYTTFEENNTAYMVMEYLEGQTLQEMVQEAVDPKGVKRPLPESEAIDYIEQVGDALRLVHNAHLIHRDVKPENIVVCHDGRAVLLDFGLNKELGDPASHSTMRLTSAIRFGSPGYSPPEQYGKQQRFGPYTDIYALGATLYYVLTGEVPTEAPERMYGDELVTVRSLNGKVSPKVNDAVMWALELKGDDRPQTVQEFVKALHVGRVTATAPQHQPSPATQRSTVAVSKQQNQAAAPLPGVTYAPAPLLARAAQQTANTTRSVAAVAMPGTKQPNAQAAPLVAPVPQRVYRHFKSGLLEILPRLAVIVALLALAIFFAKSQQPQPMRHLKGNGMGVAVPLKHKAVTRYRHKR